MDYSTVYLAVLVLLGLSILTIELCRYWQVSDAVTEAQFLFRGKKASHAFTSNVGSMFSATYFFGAVIVFSKLLGAWMVLVIILVCAISSALYRRLLKLLDSELGQEILEKQDDNPLMKLLQQRLGPEKVRSLAGLYVVIYFALLIEELAVSRALLNSIFPSRPVVASGLLLIVCIIMLVYLYAGGFRAVLVSDFVQTVVLLAFIVTLIYFSLTRNSTVGSSITSTALSPTLVAGNILATSLLGVSWFVSGIDFTSRLNFDSQPDIPLITQRIRVVKMSFFALALTLLAGALFGHSTHEALSPHTLPPQYLETLAALFLGDSLRIVKVVFFVSIFCMIFTTLDTLLLAMLQSSYYTRPKLARRSGTQAIIALAAAASILVPPKALYVFGIVAASMTTLPMLIVLGVLYPVFKSTTEVKLHYIWAAFATTWLLYLAFGGLLVEEFEVQFLIPCVPFLLALLFMIAQHQPWRGMKGGPTWKK